jgi:hypothetical protein
MQHYPGRLKRLFLVGLPPNLAWVVDTLRPLLHPTTAAALRLCSADDPALPLPPSALEDAPGSPATPGSHHNGTVRAVSSPLSLMS